MTSILSSETPGIIQFENANEGRSYPFTDNSILESSSGAFLPDDFITDLHLIVPNGYFAFLSSAYISGSLISVCLKTFSFSELIQKLDFSSVRLLEKIDSIEQTKEEFNRVLSILKSANIHTLRSNALSAIVRVKEFSPYRPYRLEPLSGTEDFGGIITFGNIDFPDHPVDYRFRDFEAVVTESALARYLPARLRKIVDPRTGASVNGDVRIDFTSYAFAQKTPDGVHLDLAEAAKTELLTDCDKSRPQNICGTVPVNSINGVTPFEGDPKRRIAFWFH